MMKGFFEASTVTSKAPMSSVPQCGACGLAKKCNSPKLPVAGKGRRKILIVTKGPTADEDDEGRWLSSPSPILVRGLQAVGIDLFKDCWTTGALICHEIDKGKHKDASKRIDFCRPNLSKLVRQLKPNVIIPMGQEAVSSLLGFAWKEAPGSLERWDGQNIPCQKLNAWICPVVDPTDVAAAKNPVVSLQFSRNLEQAAEHDEAPWQTLPNWEGDVEPIVDPNAATARLQALYQDAKRAGGDGWLAYDLECDRLKPDAPDSQIVSASLTYGTGPEPIATIAYPWHGETIEWTKRFLQSPLRKIAANMKFEQRWTMRKIRRRVRNWSWDTMLAAHILDNRKGTKSLSFQTFCVFGQESYEDHISPYLKSSRDSDVNQIQDIALRQLLVYNGMDTLLEYRLAMHQRKLLGYED